MKNKTKETTDLSAWSLDDIQSVHAEDEYEAVAEVLNQRQYGYNTSNYVNNESTWSAYD